MSTETEKLHPLLPKLGSNNQIGNFNRYGVWDQRELIELDRLSDGLKVERVATQINSIPDMWARPLLFEMALYDTDHLLHKRTAAEWRGLLALLALKEVKEFNVRVVEALPMTEKKDSDGNIVELIPKDEKKWPPFLSTLAKMAPNKNTLSPDTLWLDVQTQSFPFIILLNDKPIGLLSPTTMVCTSTNCFNRLTGISWSDGRFLKDPSGKLKENESEKTNELNNTEKRRLAAWLDKLKSNLSTLPGAFEENSRPNKLISLVENYIKDLGGPAGIQTILSTEGLGSAKGIFQFLDKPIKGDREGRPDSHLQLLPSEGLTPAKTLFVVDKSIAQQWNMTETNVVVYRGATLADIPSIGFGRERKQVGSIRLQDNEELCLPEDIFTPNLCVIYQENALPGAMASPGSGSLKLQNQVVTPLLPLTEKILPHIENADLQRNIIFEQSFDESIHIRLRLKLAGPDGSGKFVEFKREYRKDDIVRLEGVPVLEIWPNLSKKNWELYFTYFSKGTRESTFYTKPYTLQGDNTTKVISGDGQRIESQITQSSFFPKAILCYALSPNVQLNRMDERYIGIILLKKPEMVTDTNDTWKIGIDFGTTSTSVYVANSNNIGERLAFRKELIATVTASGTDRTKLYDEFIAAEDEPIPFLSFYQEFRNRKKGESTDVFSDGHIFFLKPKDLGKIPKNVSTNLKWSDDELDRDRAAIFLEQVCCQALAEVASKGASKVVWRYSYPTAFSEIVSSGLPQKWQQITERCHKRTGIQRLCPVPLPGKTIVQNCKHGFECTITDHAAQKISESHATAIYFADELNASTKYGTVCIDIGGGTSDVAIWQEDKLRYQISLRLAGREILLNALRFNPDFLECFGTDVSLLRSLKTQLFEFYAQADALISREGYKWLEQLPNKLGNPELKKLVQIIAIGLSGLFFYIGQVLCFLIERKDYNPEVPDIYIGGNGSNLFHWLSAGQYDPNHPINDLFRQMLHSASGMRSNKSRSMKIVLSPEPKCEAARGLVGIKKLDIASSASDGSTVISGESIIVQGKMFDQNSLLSASTFKKSLELPAKLNSTESFLKIFNKYASTNLSGIQPISSTIVSTDLRKRLGGKLNDIGKKNQKEISVEPIFILSLKTLLEICAEEWKNL